MVVQVATLLLAVSSTPVRNPNLCRSIQNPLILPPFHFEENVNGNHKLTRRRTKRFPLSPKASSFIELPLLPFNMNEVLVPSESKTLHLYEARYLALLEESEPYLKGEILPAQDKVIDGAANEVSSKLAAVMEALHSLNSLQIKLKAPKDARLQTCIANALKWAEKEPSLECDQAFIPSQAERMSFAAFQPFSGSTPSETLKLQQQKLRAMDLKDTLQRVDDSLELVDENISRVAAKLAIQSLGMQ